MSAEFDLSLQAVLPWLAQVGDEPDARELADVLWLARFLDAPAAPARQPETPKAENEPEIDAPQPEPPKDKSPQPPAAQTAKREPEPQKIYPKIGGSGQGAALGFRTPGLPALPNALALSRALKPLRRKLPSRSRKALAEAATAEAIAAQRLARHGFWAPVWTPVREPWFELHLVVDGGATMVVWRDVVREFLRLLERSGAFRRVRIYRLDTDPAEPVLRLGLDAQASKAHAPARLAQEANRPLVLVLSDCVGPAWHIACPSPPGNPPDSAATRWLRQWAKSAPLALLHMLPRRLWDGSALGRGEFLRLYSRLAAPKASDLQKLGGTKARADWLLPVLTLEPAALRTWGRLLNGRKTAWIAGVAFGQDAEFAPQPPPDAQPVEPDAAEIRRRYDAFLAEASPEARKLAGLLAAAPLTPPVMRLVQGRLLPGSGPLHLAELFLSGLICRSTLKDPHGEPFYDFRSGVRPWLLDFIGERESKQVLCQVSAFVTERTGRALDFAALIAAPSLETLAGTGLRLDDDNIRHFAEIGAMVLRRLGGRYAELADALVSTIEKGSEPPLSEKNEVETLQTSAPLKNRNGEDSEIAKAKHPQEDILQKKKKNKYPNFLDLRVFLASPGDVASERAVARQVLDQLQYEAPFRDSLAIKTVAWDAPSAGAPMLATKTPQAAIAAGMPKPSECDIVVVIIWSRMGTPLPLADYQKPDGSAYLSGTEWEYLDALAGAEANGRPKVLVYRRTEDFPLSRRARDFKEKLRQLKNVDAFFASFTNPDGSVKNGYNEYAQPEDFREMLEAHLREIIVRLLQNHKPDEASPFWQGSPFPGLRAFAPDDAPIFFGRGREADALVQKFRDPACRFIAVIGASGSGKSSLVSAGLIPKLKNNAIPGSKDWLLIGLRFTPGEVGGNPFQALAVRLAPLLPDESPNPRRLAEQLEIRPESLTDYIELALRQRPTWAEALLFIDQFEELFTIVEARYRRPFINLLQQPGRLRWILTLRVDFLRHCSEIPELAEKLRIGLFALAAPRLSALLQMIIGPAARAELKFEEGLPERILEDVGDNPSALPLLAFALHELYEAKATDNGLLSHAAYAQIGGIGAAIGQRAEKTFQALPAEARARLSAVFRNLVDVDDQGKATRRRVAYAGLATDSAAKQLVDEFIYARILVADQTAQLAVVEVAHEALLREWKRLAEWIATQAGDFRLRRYAEISALEWQRAGNKPSQLWHHEMLIPVYEALERLGVEREQLTEPLKTFLRPEAERLLEELANLKTSHDRRAAIGDRLEVVGDLRPGVGIGSDGIPDVVWCQVPPGQIQLENVKGVFEVNSGHISKYPITYCQYQAFLDDPGGYQNSAWWKDLQHETSPGQQFRRSSNRPAENVSWYDAIAYCRWFSAKLGYEVRLPTEWEWQQAASGGQPMHKYPWGSLWENGRANTNESNLVRTIAVGMYPYGASPVGALDMAGNVREWCLNESEKPERQEYGIAAHHAVRGGSWNSFQVAAQITSRDDFLPNSRNDFIGFRLFTSSHV